MFGHTNLIIVVDDESCCVFIFQLDGKLVTKFGSRGNSDRQFACNRCTVPYCCLPLPSEEVSAFQFEL